MELRDKLVSGTAGQNGWLGRRDEMAVRDGWLRPRDSSGMGSWVGWQDATVVGDGYAVKVKIVWRLSGAQI